MEAYHFEGANIVMNAPKSWDADAHGECRSLYAHKSTDDVFTTVWAFTDEERARIASGENLAVSCVGGLPPMAMQLTDLKPAGQPSAGFRGELLFCNLAI